jgi:DNA polymerase elongation subunit (family B)
MKTVYFDIETIPCQLPGVRDEYIAAVQAPAKYSKPESIAEWLRENREAEGEAAWLKTSFDGGVGHVCCIGLAVDDEAPRSYQTPADAIGNRNHEAQVLMNFFSDLTSIGRSVIVGHNIIGFDLPFIWKRCMVLGVKPPLWFPRNPSKYSSETVRDTMLMWDQDQRAGAGMDRICKLMGIPGKGDISGADVWPMVAAGDIDGVAEYCRADVRRTRLMFKRMTFAEDMPTAQHTALPAATPAKATTPAAVPAPTVAPGAIPAPAF